MMVEFNGKKLDLKAEDIALAYTVKSSDASTLEDFLDELAENIRKISELKDKGKWLY